MDNRFWVMDMLSCFEVDFIIIIIFFKPHLLIMA